MTSETKPQAHELVQDPDYFRDVMRNMEWVSGKECRRVRFGTTGEGHFPNYQTGWPSEYPMGHTVRRFSGRTHSAYHDTPHETYDEDRLSRAFTWEEVRGMLAGRLPPKK